MTDYERLMTNSLRALRFLARFAFPGRGEKKIAMR